MIPFFIKRYVVNQITLVIMAGVLSFILNYLILYFSLPKALFSESTSIFQWLQYSTLGNLSYIFPFLSIIGTLYFWSNCQKRNLLPFFEYNGGNVRSLKIKISIFYSFIHITFFIMHFSYYANLRKEADVIMQDDILKMFSLPIQLNLIGTTPLQVQNDLYLAFSYSESEPDAFLNRGTRLYGLQMINVKNSFELIAGSYAYIDGSKLYIMDPEIFTPHANPQNTTKKTYTIDSPKLDHLNKIFNEVRFVKVSSMNFFDLVKFTELNFYFSLYQPEMLAWFILLLVQMVLLPIFSVFYFNKLTNIYASRR